MSSLNWKLCLLFVKPVSNQTAACSRYFARSILRNLSTMSYLLIHIPLLEYSILRGEHHLQEGCRCRRQDLSIWFLQYTVSNSGWGPRDSLLSKVVTCNRTLGDSVPLLFCHTVSAWDAIGIGQYLINFHRGCNVMEELALGCFRKTRNIGMYIGKTCRLSPIFGEIASTLFSSWWNTDFRVARIAGGQVNRSECKVSTRKPFVEFWQERL